MNKPLRVSIKFFYYDKNSEEKYCTTTKDLKLSVTEDFCKYLANKDNLKFFMSYNELAGVTISKENNKEFDLTKVAVENLEIHNIIDDCKKEVIKELKQKGFTFVKVGKPHEVLNKKNYEEQER